VSKIIEDDCIPSTSGYDELSSTSPKCGKTQANDMMSCDKTCNGDSMLMILNGALTNSSLSSHVTNLCLMARGSKVSPTLEPKTSCVDVDEHNDDQEDENIYEEEDIIRREGEIIYNALPDDMKVRSLFVKIVSSAIESQKKH
jgi:hypothetical protein